MLCGPGSNIKFDEIVINTTHFLKHQRSCEQSREVCLKSESITPYLYAQITQLVNIGVSEEHLQAWIWIPQQAGSWNLCSVLDDIDPFQRWCVCQVFNKDEIFCALLGQCSSHWLLSSANLGCNLNPYKFVWSIFILF